MPGNEVPRELTGLARWTFRLKYDGLVSHLVTADLATGKVLERKTLWYTSDSDNTSSSPAGKTTYILNRVNICAEDRRRQDRPVRDGRPHQLRPRRLARQQDAR